VKFAALVITEFHRALWLMRRRPVDTLLRVLWSACLFGVLLGSGAVVAGGLPTQSVTQLLLGFPLAQFVITMINVPTEITLGESTGRNIEVLYISGNNLVSVIAARFVGTMGIQLLQTSVLLSLLLLATQIQVNWNPWMLIPFTALLVESFGLGLLIAAVILFSKESSGLLAFVQIGVVFLSISSFDQWWSFALPIASLVKQIREISSSNLHLSLVIYNFCAAFFYFFLGVLAFQKAEKYAKRNGTLGFS
jgi:hypothetical protein